MLLERATVYRHTHYHNTAILHFLLTLHILVPVKIFYPTLEKTLFHTDSVCVRVCVFKMKAAFIKLNKNISN